MSIAKLLEQHEVLVKEARQAAKFGAVTAAQITRSADVQQQRAAAIKQRIEALETAKQEHIKQADEAIEALREDLAGLEQRIASDRDLLEPVLGTIRRERNGSVVTGGTAARKSTRQVKSTKPRRKEEEEDK